MINRVLYLVVIWAALSLFQSAQAKEGNWSASVSGLVDFSAQKEWLEPGRLVADPALLGLESGALVQTGRVNLEAWQGNLALNTQFRLVLANDQDRKVKAIVDDLYCEYSVTEKAFLYLGRRNVVLGQSYGINPLDVFFDPLDLDRTLNESRRRREMEGQDILGFEILSSENITLSSYWAPSFDSLNEGAPDRALIAAKLLLPDLNADLALLAFDDDRPGTGFSFTKMAGGATLLYSDVTVRRGRDHLQIYRDQAPSALPGDFVTEEEGRQSYIESGVGLSYSFPSSATLNVEYYYNQNGYSHAEWDTIDEIINTNAANLKHGLYGNLPEGNLLQLNSALRHSSLRRHYGFVRFYHPDAFGVGASIETTVFHNLEDQSGVAGLRLEYGVNSSVILGVYGSANYSGGRDEFWLRNTQLSSIVYVTFYM